MREYWKQIAGDMFDFEEFYEGAAEQMPDGSTFVEVGVANGKSLIFLAEAMLNRGKKCRVIGVDDCSYGKQEQRNEILRNITLAGVGDFVEFWEMDSLTASCKFPDGLLNMVFIDSSHKYEETKAEIRLWYRKIMEGGVLAGHDVLRELEVRKAVFDTIPYTFTRPQLDETIFDEVKVVSFISTTKGYGVWTAVKIWYVNLK